MNVSETFDAELARQFDAAVKIESQVAAAFASAKTRAETALVDRLLDLGIREQDARTLAASFFDRHWWQVVSAIDDSPDRLMRARSLGNAWNVQQFTDWGMDSLRQAARDAHAARLGITRQNLEPTVHP